jgi:hypothetical protein
MVNDDIPPYPSLADLHQRHYGLTERIASYYAEATAICMQRHHASPKTVNISADNTTARDYLMASDTPSDRQMAAWANRDDATRDAAYGMVIAAAEVHLELFVIGRAAPGSGSDYLFGPRSYNQQDDELLDFEDLDVFRLEVSGIDRCTGDAHLGLDFGRRRSNWGAPDRRCQGWPAL